MDEPIIRTAMKNHAIPSPNFLCGFQPSFSSVSLGYRPSKPTQSAKIATPTTTASQLNFHRISSTKGRVSRINQAATSVLTRYIQYRNATSVSPCANVSATKAPKGTKRASSGEFSNFFLRKNIGGQ